MRARAAVLAAFGAVLLAGCGGSSSRTEQPLETWVGRLDDPSIYIALISDGQELAGYLTDGRAISVWFAGADLDQDTIPLVQRSGPLIGQAERTGDGFEGSVRLGPESFNFSADPVTGPAGLYYSSEQGLREDATMQAGWIVQADGSERGAYDTYIEEVVRVHPAPKLEATVEIPGFGPQLPHEFTSIYFETLPKVSG